MRSSADAAGRSLPLRRSRERPVRLGPRLLLCAAGGQLLPYLGGTPSTLRDPHLAGRPAPTVLLEPPDGGPGPLRRSWPGGGRAVPAPSPPPGGQRSPCPRPPRRPLGPRRSGGGRL